MRRLSRAFRRSECHVRGSRSCDVTVLGHSNTFLSQGNPRIAIQINEVQTLMLENAVGKGPIKLVKEAAGRVPRPAEVLKVHSQFALRIRFGFPP